MAVLSLGAVMDADNQVPYLAAYDMGVRSKSSIFGEAGPGSHAVVWAEELDRRLELSFQRMNTDYVDV